MKSGLICLMALFVFLSPVSDLKAQEFRKTDPLLLDYFWGEDVILAAPVEFATTSIFTDDPETLDGVMFPLYFGYLSFYDENGQKAITFTPAISASNYNFQFVTSLFESINTAKSIIVDNF